MPWRSRGFLPREVSTVTGEAHRVLAPRRPSLSHRVDRSRHRSAGWKNVWLRPRFQPEDLPALAALLDPARSHHERGPPLETPDDYYFGLREKPRLPVYRVILDDADRTRYYLDPRTGELLQKTDRNSRLYRWLFEAVHRWDFAVALRTARPLGRGDVDPDGGCQRGLPDRASIWGIRYLFQATCARAE